MSEAGRNTRQGPILLGFTAVIAILAILMAALNTNNANNQAATATVAQGAALNAQATSDSRADAAATRIAEAEIAQADAGTAVAQAEATQGAAQDAADTAATEAAQSDATKVAADDSAAVAATAAAQSDATQAAANDGAVAAATDAAEALATKGAADDSAIAAAAAAAQALATEVAAGDRAAVAATERFAAATQVADASTLLTPIPVTLTAVADLQSQSETDRAVAAAYGAALLGAETDPVRSLALLNDVVAEFPEAASAFSARGALYQSIGDLDAALADFDTAIELEPETALYYRNRGTLLRDLGDLDGALADFDSAIDLAPRDPFAYDGRGTVYLALGDLDAAEADFGQAITIDNDISTFYRNRALVYIAQGNTGRAIGEYNVAIRLNPDDFVAYARRGELNILSGEFEDAIDDADDALAINPAFALAYAVRAEARYFLVEYDVALDDANTAIALEPDVARYYLVRARIHFNLDDFDAELTDYNTAIALDPTFADAYVDRGYYFYDTFDYDAATADWLQAEALGLELDEFTQGLLDDLLIATPSGFEFTPPDFSDAQSASIGANRGTLVGFNDLWRYDGTAGELVTITLMSNDFDTYLYIYDTDDFLLDFNDDAFDDTLGLNSQLVDFPVPSDGVLLIEVTSFSGAGEGAYTLTINSDSATAQVQPTTVPLPTVTPNAAALATFADATATNLGENGGAYSATETEIRRYEGTAGQTISVSISASQFDASFIVYDSNGTALALGNILDDIVVPDDGVLFFEIISTNDDDMGPYVLTIDVTAAPSETAAGDLVLGDNTGTLNTEGGETFTYTGTPGEVLDITLTSEDFDTYLFIYDSDNTLLVENDDAADVELGFNSQVLGVSVPADGILLIEVDSFGGIGTGDYTLTLAVSDATAAASMETATIDESDFVLGVNTGTLTQPAGETLSYIGTPGEVIDIRVESIDFTPSLLLLNSDTTLLDLDNGPEQFLFDDVSEDWIGVTMPDDGVLLLDLASLDGSSTGDYTMIITARDGSSLLLPTQPPVDQSADVAGTLAGLGSTTDEISVGGGDLWIYVAPEAQELTITLTSDSFDTQLFIYDAEDNLLASNDDAPDLGLNSQVADLPLSAGQEISIEVRSWADSDGGPYTLDLSSATAALPTPTLMPTAVSPFGELRSAIVGTNAGFVPADGGDFWRYDGPPGQIIAVDATASQFQDRVLAYDSAETLLGFGEDLFVISLPDDGAIFFEVRGVDGSGAYLLTIEVTSEVVPFPDAAQAQVGTSAGFIAADDSDFWRYDGPPAQIIAVDATASQFEPEVLAYDSAGTPLGLAESVLLPDDGAIFFEVRGVDGSGAYLMTIEVTEDPEAAEDASAALEPEDTVDLEQAFADAQPAQIGGNSGVVPAGGSDFWRYDGPPAQIVAIATSASEFEPEVLAYDSAGTPLGFPESVLLPSDGIVYFEVRGADGSGDYQIALLDRGQSTSALAPQTVIDARFADALQARVGFNAGFVIDDSSQFWRFAGLVGETITLSVQSTSFDPVLVAYSADGSEIEIEGPLTLEEPLLLVEVRTAAGEPGGAYLLVIESQRSGATIATASPAILGQNSGTTPVGGAQFWAYEASAGQVLTISVVADRPANETSGETRVAQSLYDSWLTVRNGNGTIIAEDDDIVAGVETNSLIERLVITADTTLSIEVSSWEDLSGGPYTLIIEQLDESDSP